jgi:hypothetical protein
MDSDSAILGSFTNAQIAVLQQQIRLYKALGKRFNESNVVKALSGENISSVVASSSNSIPQSNDQVRSTTTTIQNSTRAPLEPPRVSYSVAAAPASKSVPAPYASEVNDHEHIPAAEPVQRTSSNLSSAKPRGSIGSGRVAGRPSIGISRTPSANERQMIPLTATTGMSWQIFNTLVFSGPARNMHEGTLALNSSVGVFFLHNY